MFILYVIVGFWKKMNGRDIWVIMPYELKLQRIRKMSLGAQALRVDVESSPDTAIRKKYSSRYGCSLCYSIKTEKEAEVDTSWLDE